MNKAGKFLLIVNPASGKQHHEARINSAREWFDRHGQEFEVRRTTRPGEAADLARDACQVIPPYDAVLAAGGDGTINEVVNGLAGTGMALGLLPWGTTNVFALEMGIPARLHAQCRLILRGQAVRLDLGRFNGRAFLLMAGIGFDAYALGHAGLLKRQIGPLAYVVGGLRSFFRYRHLTLRYSVPGGRPRDSAFLLVSNTSRYGGIFHLSPKAHPADGMLDVYAWRERGRWRLLKLVLSLIMSVFHPAHRWRRRFFYLRDNRFLTRELLVESDGPVQVQLDGDHAGSLPGRITVDPGAIRVILPARTRKKLAVVNNTASPEPGT